MKRFYEEVEIVSSLRRRPGSQEGDAQPSNDPDLSRGDEIDYGVALDGRPVRTPKKAVLTLPNLALAEGVAEEWRSQGDKVEPHTMKLTGLANAAIDIVAPDCATFAASLAAYGESDLLCYRAEDPLALMARQNAAWDPLLDWAQARYDVAFTRVAGVMHRKQPDETVARLGTAIGQRSAFELAALSHLVTISGSLVIALAVIEREIAGEAAFDTAHLDELWQAEQWGEDYFAIQTRDAHRADFLAAARFLDLLSG